MYHFFNEYYSATKFIIDFNRDKEDNQPKAKFVAWPHTQVKRHREWIVFTPKAI